ncbi:hypothetical protein A3D42_03270 [Candidatus Nomurabacteria bacterium RIFCSPHIGHO2_02_FULL_41_18]|uniref:Transcriptional repressor PaaX-like central Cas2-like domain-containing protein n=1 Tax=Candidatus Nomurabacteria bacterium RIFCSPHIGHO2_02_FULL_41_18 TaxID=1801754 RepID=A0A1F6W890_9BACT|nr:MAG: hypothetical protein A2737_01360 [Candidatus Nomurabacteria bacterium RIFCSPHIGHO2_01_FULL_41_71]OGI78054.1 MAG: hypothetical protein A3D42_03270 [Candidatus Nomurabacteria bacterium RIFCSPHIGHO2_02_FULL_41_18]OGI90109.1 MAG: hypothetical protein A3B01_03310 [Candidatus Nomurabacteria bacterium RIFCSPLOWO2_01_FULL_41_52b]OGJ00203.1 MAG: hypothetical protein A3I90_01915 [Candidatus Nomurabacteria bacterium RIFCSPLOWO2_02_FULL_41_9]
MRNIDRESNTGKIIRALGYGVGITFALANQRTSFKMAKTLIKEIFGTNRKPKNVNQYFYKLRQQKIISFKEQDGFREIMLTEEGKEIFLRFSYEDICIKNPKIWDRQFRMIIFDIPEKKRKARDALRDKLRDLGCVKYNDSVWVYPYPCQEEIDFIANYWKVGKYVQFALVRDLTNKLRLEKIFNL